MVYDLDSSQQRLKNVARASQNIYLLDGWDDKQVLEFRVRYEESKISEALIITLMEIRDALNKPCERTHLH